MDYFNCFPTCMLPLTLHHYGFLTADTAAWLAENELLFGQPYNVSSTIFIQSQNVSVTFVQQHQHTTLTELIQPAEENTPLQKLITKGVTVYHTAYKVRSDAFDDVVKKFEENGSKLMPIFQSEAFNLKRCIFLVTKNMGMIELIEE